MGTIVILEGEEVVDTVHQFCRTHFNATVPDANATATLCHSRSRDVTEYCRRADSIVAAMGVAGFVKADMVKPGATVIDVGVNRIDDPAAEKGYRLVGDVDFAAVQPVAGKITPNPGGVGPMTIAMLMRNTVRAAEQQTGEATR